MARLFCPSWSQAVVFHGSWAGSQLYSEQAAPAVYQAVPNITQSSGTGFTTQRKPTFSKLCFRKPNKWTQKLNSKGDAIIGLHVAIPELTQLFPKTTCEGKALHCLTSASRATNTTYCYKPVITLCPNTASETLCTPQGTVLLTIKHSSCWRNPKHFALIPHPREQNSVNRSQINWCCCVWDRERFVAQILPTSYDNKFLPLLQSSWQAVTHCKAQTTATVSKSQVFNPHMYKV